MTNGPDKAFILAAGFGTRLRPHTLELPKPLVEVDDKAMIDHVLEKIHDAGIKECVINTHYLAEKLERHLKNYRHPIIHISNEEKILDTGGGIKNALSYFDAPFYVLSGDSIWEDAPGQSALQALENTWNPEEMDILMLLQPVENMALTKGVGDYDIDENGRARRALDQSGSYMFTSIRINHPRIFENAPEGPFSYLELMDKAQEQGRLYGLVHHGAWHHISTPEDLEKVNNALQS